MRKQVRQFLEIAEGSIRSGFPALGLSRPSLLLTLSWGGLGWKERLWIPSAILIASVFLLPPWLLLYFTENVTSLSSIDGTGFLWRLAIFGIFVSICLGLGIYGSGVLSAWLEMQVRSRLRNSALANLLEARLDHFDGEQDEWAAAMGGAFARCEEFLGNSLPRQIKDLTLAAGTGILFFTHGGWLALIPLAAAVALACLHLWAERKWVPSRQQAQPRESALSQAALACLDGVRTIRSFGGEETIKQAFHEQLSQDRQAGMRASRAHSALSGIHETASHLVISLVLAILAFRLRGGGLTVNEALIFPFYLHLFLHSAKSLAASLPDWRRCLAETERLASLVSLPSVKTSPENSVKGILGVTALEGRHLTIRRGNHSPAISGFNIRVNRGELVLLTGPSGPEKTTLLEALAGLRELNGGEWYLSTARGVTENVPIVPRSLWAFVERRPFLFAGSLRANITLGQPARFDIEIRSALKALGLETVVDQLGGLDALLADCGQDWSESQRYRLALCRAMVSNRPFWALDEPFAAFENSSAPELERILQLAKKAGTGIILAAQDPPPGLKADHIVTFDVKG